MVSKKVAFHKELKNIYHHHPESKKRKSSEANSGSIHPYGRYENAVKTREPYIYHSDSLACQGHFREEGRYGGGRYFHFPCFRMFLDPKNTGTRVQQGYKNRCCTASQKLVRYIGHEDDFCQAQRQKCGQICYCSWPPNQKPEQRYPKTGTRVHSPKRPFYKAAGPFVFF